MIDSMARTQSPDTSPEAERILVERWARLTPAEKLRVVGELGRTAEAVAAAGIRAARPAATDDEIRIEIATRRYGPALVEAALAARARRR